MIILAKTLSEMIADDIYTMIAVENRFRPGEKLPNENELAKSLNINRSTLREANKILVTRNVLEIKRGKGTFVREDFGKRRNDVFSALAVETSSVQEVFEMRMIIEPEAAYYATLRATENEMRNIISLGELLEQKIRDDEDRVNEELEFHKAIAKATHNSFMNRLMPVLLQAVYLGVVKTQHDEEIRRNTLRDHRLLMDFMESRDAVGAKNAMRLHMIHASTPWGK